MKAVILAAGRGSRLQALTDDRPKALVPLNGIPLLARTVTTLRQSGVNDIGIVAGYRGEMLTEYADTMFSNAHWARSGIFQSLSCASEWLSEQPCLVSYGDIFYDSALVRALIEHPADIALGFDPYAVDLWRKRFEDPLPDLENFRSDNGWINAIGQPAENLDAVQGQYMGLFKTTPVGWSALKAQLCQRPAQEHDHADMTSLLGTLVDSGFPVAGVATYEPWGEIDCPSDVALYERLFPHL